MYTLANWGSSFNPKGLVGSGKISKVGDPQPNVPKEKQEGHSGMVKM
jgi:hypothetical protein